MGVETLVHTAIERVSEEREHTVGQLAAVDDFTTGVSKIEPAPALETMAARPLTDGGVGTLASRHCNSSADRRKRVRDLFDETIRPYSVDDVDDEPLLVTVGEELTREVAVALSPSTDSRFTDQLKRAILSEAASRRAELNAVSLALECEAESLEAAVDEIDPIVDWLCRTNETPLLECDFETLRDRHETLAHHRERCRELAGRRQTVVHGTANYNAEAGIHHHTVLEFLYQGLPTTYPVLTTALRLEQCCRDCQRAVRDHLVRRV